MPKYLLKDIVKKSVEPKKEIIQEPTKNKSRYLLWLVAFVSLCFFVFALSFLFSRAEISVTPKTEKVTLNENLSADKDSGADGLFFNLVGPISGDESVTIKANGEKDVSTKAVGTVCIFNTYSAASQKLNINTRLEGSNGKIYTTQIPMVVSGINKGNNSACPNEVGISAAEAGAEYNSSPLDFTIFGFKGTPKYSKFIVRSKTGTEITGGFLGKAPDVSPADTATALSELKTNLKTKLLIQMADQIPSGFILFKDATFLDADDLNVSSNYNNQDNTMTLTQKGVLYGLIFNEQKLTQKIAQDNIDNYDGSDVFIPNIKNLTFSLPTGQAGLANQDNTSFDNLQNINFNLSGPAQIVWKLDVDKFTADLLGKSKKDFNQTLFLYPNIDSATLTLSPIWEMSIPSKIKNVKVIVNYPQ